MLNKTRKGKLIVIYGVNGTGKSIQTAMLVRFLKTQSLSVGFLKYPIYRLRPEGPFIDKYLRDPKFRKKNPQSAEELQEKYAQNRFRFEPELIRRLTSGEWIVSEDYVGTGIAWGLTWGADLSYLEKVNEGLLRADFSILLHGRPFQTNIEKGHRNEENNERMRICKNFHFLLGKKCGWEIINASQAKEDVHKDIVSKIVLV